MRAELVVDPYRTIGRIDPLIYGQFLSRRRWVSDEGLHDPAHPDADEHGLRREVVTAVAESAPTIIRWPGGCTGTSYDWRDGVGPQAERPRSLDVHFGYDVGNGFGTAEFVAFCRRLGAEPHLNLNTGTGTLAEALAWVEYTNLATDSHWANLRRAHGHDVPFDVRYWQIGNENYGPWEIGHQSPADYAIMAREWGKAIKKLDPTLKVLAVGGSQFGPEWDFAVLSEAWDQIDYLTAHRYWDFRSAEGIDNYATIAGTGYLEEQTIIGMAGMLDLIGRERRATRRPLIAFTEWNARDIRQAGQTMPWRPLAPQYRQVDALAAAGFLNALQRQCRHVGLATVAQTLNVVGLLFVTPEQVVREPVYWACLMQRCHSGPIAVDAHVECGGYSAEFEGRVVAGIPDLDLSATRSETGDRLYLSIVNRHRTEEIAPRIRLRDARPRDAATVHRLVADDPLHGNTLAQPDAIVPHTTTIALPGPTFEVSLPPHSYTIIEVPL